MTPRNADTRLTDGELMLFAQGHASPAMVSAARELRDARMQLEAVAAAVRDVHAGRAQGMGLAFEVERALAKRALLHGSPATRAANAVAEDPAPARNVCNVCEVVAPATVCDRCSRPICYGCEVSGGASSQMLCAPCQDQMYANANAVAKMGKPR